ncbi:hypothetical protein DF3PA_70129 [Candidatus Defluviicoccus seviourii]|uniref:Uncharacterized protein n=1 Tax=Candidatus Defluviicoccus seviourii TaxID=2565273 RepID=A0A564WIM8_9PROT|nr:hypothetical protein DF3PA_70129 [Candidatus Defluviicoccus seviourii]
MINEDRGEAIITINGVGIPLKIDMDRLKRLENSLGKNLRVFFATLVNPMQGLLSDIVTAIAVCQSTPVYDEMAIYYMIVDDLKSEPEEDFYLRVMKALLPLFLGKSNKELEEESKKK